MEDSLSIFEKIARRAYKFTDAVPTDEQHQHPFSQRNIHESIELVAIKLFNDGHYSQASFEAFKFVDNEIQIASNSSDSGFKLMMSVLGGEVPNVCLTPMKNTSDKDEQKGYQFLFAGSILAIRNPRAHDVLVKDDIDLCLDHLALASFLMRKLRQFYG
jgi:uncharacterized protein (TIGR02391 family)